MIRKEKRNYYFKKFNEVSGSSKYSWQLVNELLNKKTKNSTYETIKNNFKITEPEIPQLANNFNNYFKNHIDRLNNNITGPPFNINIKNDTTPNTNILLQKLSMETLQKIINNLNSNAAPGPDEIRPKHIKIKCNSMHETILQLINTIITTCTIPEKMKSTHIKPIYKSGTKNKIENYRPIGAVNVLLKILEYHIHQQISKYCIEQSLLNPHQYGFTTGKSTTQLLQKVIDTINRSLDNNKTAIGISIDLTRAFDTINYNILQQKLIKLGITNTFLKLIDNYLCNRKVSVKLGNHTSHHIIQKNGVVQGSILAPLLFNIYINDINTLTLNGKIYSYADDTFIINIHKKSNVAIQNTQTDINNLTKYFFNNNIHINPSKSKAIKFSLTRAHEQTNNIISHTHTHMPKNQQSIL